MNNIWIIAQAGNEDMPQQITSESISEGETSTVTTQDGTNGGSEQQENQQKPPNLWTWFIPIMMVFMIFMLFRAPQKQKQQRKKLEQSLEKNDRILTIGGIIGTIVDIKDDEITLKVDESNNTKIKMRRSAIGRNMSKDQ